MKQKAASVEQRGVKTLSLSKTKVKEKEPAEKKRNAAEGQENFLVVLQVKRLVSDPPLRRTVFRCAK